MLSGFFYVCEIVGMGGGCHFVLIAVRRLPNHFQPTATGA
jgi:hypothetical protein